MLVALLLLGAPACLARTPEAAGHPKAATDILPVFTDAAGPARIDGPMLSFKLTDGRTVTLSSWRFEALPGRSATRNGYRCGVRVDGQAVTVVGVGFTEVVSCDRVAAAGALSKARIGLIYRTSTPNESAWTAVVLKRADGRWALDGSVNDRLDETEPSTISQLRRAVR